MDWDGNSLTYDGSSWSSPDEIDTGNQLNSSPARRRASAPRWTAPTAFTYRAVGTLTQGTPTSASVADGAGYSGQLAVTNATGTVSYTETSSTDSADVVVNSTGAISAATSLAPGTYTVGGGDSDTNGDTGTWSFALTVNPAVVTPPPSGAYLLPLIVFAPFAAFTSLGGDQLAELLLVEFVGDLQRHQ